MMRSDEPDLARHRLWARWRWATAGAALAGGWRDGSTSTVEWRRVRHRRIRLDTVVGAETIGECGLEARRLHLHH
ncbi:Os06g0477700 [Oryza sativa Japonica Group]|uniref:Os06g0477700 protein n=1 Tax=Oryza sativa subsp. japonica TaxID=39947 RepID=A0A0P0WWL1_ORYSJ|nr:Os06g0477700 [Oryza sativa Japonica Group]